jgi:hypothetical protein
MMRNGMQDHVLSPAYQMLQHVWKSEGEAWKNTSWQRLNLAMKAALRLAIEYGIMFDQDDFRRFASPERCGGFRSWRWLGEDNGERVYALACETRFGVHMSACKAYERWRGRKPFLIMGTHGRNKRRLAVGKRFWWHDGVCYFVTSFSEDGKSLIACQYQENNPYGEKRTPLTRVRITPQELREYNLRTSRERTHAS